MIKRKAVRRAVAAFLVANGAAGSTATASTFFKDPSQFCFSRLDAEGQKQRYARIANIGASFTHGCLGCDSKEPEAQANALTGDAFWLRRNYLVRFLTEGAWKDPAWRAPGVFALENDAVNKPSGVVPAARASKEGYTGAWHFSTPRDDIQLLSPQELSAFRSATDVFGEADTVGGIEVRRDLKLRRSSQHGVALVSYARLGDAYVPLVRAFDLAQDGGRMQDLFKSQGAAEFYDALEANAWTDAELREKAIDAVAKRLSSLEPSLVLAVDILFWDSFVRTLGIVRERGTKSLVLRFLLAAMERAPGARTFFDEARATRVRQAFYEVLRRVSIGQGTGRPVPILLARMLDDAAGTFEANGYEPAIAAILGEFVASYTGRDLASEMLAWLREQSRESPTSAQGPRTATGEPTLSAAEKKRARAALESLDRSRPKDPTGKTQEARLPAFARPLTTALLLDVLKESGMLLEALGAAMDETNLHARAFTASPSNNVHLLNADEFFTDFAAFLKPETMHPSVSGARRMAAMIDRAPCAGTGGR